MASSAILPFAQLLMDRGAANSPDNRANQAVMLTDMILKNQATQQSLEAGKAKAAKDRQATKDAKDVLNTKLALIARIERDKSALLQGGYKGPLPMPSEGKTLAQLDNDALMVDKAKMEAGQRENLTGSLEDDTHRQIAGPMAAFAGFGGFGGLGGLEDVPNPVNPMTQIKDDVMVPNALSKAIGPEMTDFYRGEIENAPGDQLDTIGRDLRKDFATKSKPGTDPLKDLFEVKATVDSGGNLVRYTEIGGVIHPSINGPALIQYIEDLKRKAGRGGATPSATTTPLSSLVTNENLIADKPVWTPEEEEAAKQWDAYFAALKTAKPGGLPPLPPPLGVPQPPGYVEPTGISFQVDTGRITPEQREADQDAEAEAKTLKTKKELARDAAKFILEAPGQQMERVNKAIALESDPEKWSSLPMETRQAIKSKVPQLNAFIAQKANKPTTTAKPKHENFRKYDAMLKKQDAIAADVRKAEAAAKAYKAKYNKAPSEQGVYIDKKFYTFKQAKQMAADLRLEASNFYKVYKSDIDPFMAKPEPKLNPVDSFLHNGKLH